jgi:tRNA pseudouridine38-40 synthase
VPDSSLRTVDTTRVVRLLVAYDGTDFHGFAQSDGVTTVMGELSAATARIVRGPVELTGAGRTDAGVHAWGQVVSGLIPAQTDLGRLAHSLNGLCGPAIAVREATWARSDFSARFSATARTYRYEIWNHPAPHPLRARTSWHVPAPLDPGAMHAAARLLVGEHDFSSFCRRPKPSAGHVERSLVRRVDVARWVEVRDESAGGELLRFEITATSFCHQMVRSIVGTLVDVGLGRRAPDSVQSTLDARRRDAAGPVAPPHGLVLWSVDYDGARWDATVGSGPVTGEEPSRRGSSASISSPDTAGENNQP